MAIKYTFHARLFCYILAGMAGLPGILVCLNAWSQPPASPGSIPATLQPGEIIFVNVSRFPELSTNVQLDASGNVVLPELSGVVHVGGMTLQQAGETIATAYTQIMRRKPHVTVSRSGSSFVTRQSGRSPEMTTQLLTLKNTNAEELADRLQEMTSSGGAVVAYPNTNSIIITDTPSAVQNILKVARELDGMHSQIQQVSIQARIAEIQRGALKELGIRWFFQGNDVNGGYYPGPSQTLDSRNLKGPFNAPANNEIFSRNNSRNTTTNNGREFIGNSPFDRRMQIPVQIPKAGQMFLGIMTKDIDIGAMLDALASDNRGELLAAPTIVTTNNKMAEIKSTEEVPYTEYGFSYGQGTFSTKFLDVGIVLRVIPHVYEDKGGRYVNMELEPEISYPVGTGAGGAPIRSVRKSKTTANVRDGQTLAIGGIYRNDQHNVETGVPGVRRIPVVGKLFKHTERVKKKTELLIFVTPHVLDSPEGNTWEQMVTMPSASEMIHPVPEVQDKFRESRRE